MAVAFSGKVRQRAADGADSALLRCQVTIGPDNLTIAAAPSGSLAFDLGDIDAVEPGDYELRLHLDSGGQVLLSQFGKTFETFSHDLLEAWRERLIRCLLLEDLTEVARFDVTARLEGPTRSFASPAEVRLYESNLAVLPLGATPVQWRLTDVDRLDIDPTGYTIALVRGDERLSFSKVGRRTEELGQRLEDSLAALDRRGLEVLRTIFPFLDAARLAEVGRLMKDGRSAPVARLLAIDRRVEPALRVNVADARLRPYFDVLVGRSGIAGVHAGFKLIRAEDEEALVEPEPPPAAPGEVETASEETPEPVEAAEPETCDEATSQVLYWFFFRLPSPRGGPDTLAWEATSRSGRATYFFSLAAGPDEQGGIDRGVTTLDRALGTLNFRREPIYLSDDTLDIQPRYHRYAIAARKIPELRALRRAFRGRAVHTTLAAWLKQVEKAS